MGRLRADTRSLFGVANLGLMGWVESFFLAQFAVILFYTFYLGRMDSSAELIIGIFLVWDGYFFITLVVFTIFFIPWVGG